MRCWILLARQPRQSKFVDWMRVPRNSSTAERTRCGGVGRGLWLLGIWAVGPVGSERGAKVGLRAQTDPTKRHADQIRSLNGESANYKMTPQLKLGLPRKGLLANPELVGRDGRTKGRDAPAIPGPRTSRLPGDCVSNMRGGRDQSSNELGDSSVQLDCTGKSVAR